MTYSEQLKRVVDGLIGDRTLRGFAVEAGCDYTLLHDMRRHGKIPRRETIARIADSLRLEGEQRAELFAAAGYIETTAPCQEAVAA